MRWGLHPRLLEDDLSLKINERREEKEKGTRRREREEKEREEEREEKREVGTQVGTEKKMRTGGTAYLRAYSLHCVHYYNGPITQTNSSRNLLDGCMCTHIHACVYVYMKCEEECLCIVYIVHTSQHALCTHVNCWN